MGELKIYEIEANDSIHRSSFDVVEVFTIIAYSYEDAVNHIKKHTRFEYFDLIQELEIKDGEYTMTATSWNL